MTPVGQGIGEGRGGWGKERKGGDGEVEPW